MATNITLLSDSNQYCIFNSDTYQLYSIDECTYGILSHYLRCNDIESTSKEYDLVPDELQSILNQIGFKQYEEIIHQGNPADSYNKIQRITVHVANDCNLRCKYCYASGGTYNLPRKLMSQETAIRFVEYCCETFEEIENIVFFGGEPLLNLPIIELICRLFHEKFNNGKISYLPNFGAITNGTISSDSAFAIIRKYFSFITVSLDGPKEINDVNRVFPNGNGSHNHVDTFIRTINTFDNLKIGIEATFTRSHQEAGYSKEDIHTHLSSEYGNVSIDVIDEMGIDQEIMASERIEKPFESAWFRSILSTITTKQTESKCAILHKIFALSSDGNIFPCHMNVGDGMDSVASIWESGQKVREVLNSSTNYRLKDNSTCATCWAMKFCGGCSRRWFYNSKDKQYTDTPLADRCNDFRRIARLSLLKICAIRRNPALWQELLQRLKINNT